MLKRFCWFIVLGLLFIHFSVYSDFTPEPAEDKSNRQRLLLNQFKFLSENRFFDTTDSNSIELSNTLYLGAGLELFGQTPIGLNVKTGIEIEYFVEMCIGLFKNVIWQFPRRQVSKHHHFEKVCPSRLQCLSIHLLM